MAMKQTVEYLRGLRYKIRVSGIPVDGPVFIYGDNQSVLANTTRPESTIKKKSQSITYHFLREGCVMTKPLSEEKRKKFARTLLHHIYDDVA